MKSTPISAIGEFGLINQIKTWIPDLKKTLITGPGDDAAVYESTPGTLQVLSTDLLIEGVQFDLTYQSMKQLGYKTVITGISDILAMNATPRFLTLALAIPKKVSVELLEDWYAGVNLACREFQVQVAGGDISASSGNLMISVTATGAVIPADLVTRAGSKPGDLIVVTGYPGRAYAGLKVLLREKEFYLSQPESYQPALQQSSWCIEGFLTPRPPLHVLRQLNAAGIRPTALIDLSDGLANDLFQILVASGTGARLQEELLPSHDQIRQVADQFGEEDIQYVLYGGDDFGFLMTVSPDHLQQIDDMDDLTVIGAITDNASTIELVDPESGARLVEPLGWGPSGPGGSPR